VILSTQTLGNLWIQEGYKCKCSEWLGYEYICDFTILGEILAQVFRLHVLSASTHKHLAWHLLNLALLYRRQIIKIISYMTTANNYKKQIIKIGFCILDRKNVSSLHIYPKDQEKCK
jgi:hypothetical protein